MPNLFLLMCLVPGSPIRRQIRSYLSRDIRSTTCLCAVALGQSQTTTMSALVSALERKLVEFVSTEPVDWKFYVQVFTWSVCLFESYLL